MTAFFAGKDDQSIGNLASRYEELVSSLSQSQWTAISKVLLHVGVVVFVCLLISTFALDSYFVYRRPRIPQPERQWTVPLIANPGPRYGSIKDRATQDRLGFWMIISFVIPAAGAAIRELKLNR